jgi:hypothetical protein
MYSEAVAGINAIAAQLAAHGINDAAACKANTSTTASLVGTTLYDSIIGAIGSDLFRCACENATFVQSPHPDISPKKLYAGVIMLVIHDQIYTAFSDGTIFYSKDGNNLGGGGDTSLVYQLTKGQIAVAMLSFKNGIVTAFNDGKIFNAKDGNNLGGGGDTSLVYQPTNGQIAVAMRSFKNAFNERQNLLQQGREQSWRRRRYIAGLSPTNGQIAVAMLPFKNGIVTRLQRRQNL